MVRLRSKYVFLRLNTVHLMLNPVNIDDAESVGDILIQIEKIKKRLIYVFIRLNTVLLMLNPVNIEDAESVGDILIQIEKIRSRDL